MPAKKKGYPEAEELVLCTVTGINPHSVFCRLDEYENRSGMIHISEIAPGRIKNIKEYVQMGKKLVCKVLQINIEKGHIDLSLRRVNENQKRTKLNEIKQEQLAEKIVEQVARTLGREPAALYRDVTTKLGPVLFPIFEEVSHDERKLDLDAKTAAALTEAIKARIKPPEVHIDGMLSLTCYAPNGVELVKETLDIAVKAGAEVHYLGAGTYHIEVISEDYKDAEKKMRAAIEPLIEHAEKLDIEAKWQRKED